MPWLSALRAPAVFRELQGLADRDEKGTLGQLSADFGPNSNLSQTFGGWTGMSLMNKGAFNHAGCLAAPQTCEALDSMSGHLAPRPGSEQVGVRILKLDAGASIRPHLGPGGRLVAHLGLKIPNGSALIVAGKRTEWREGAFTIFDDSVLHSAYNRGTSARYILHVTFPLPLPEPDASVAVGFASPIASRMAEHFNLSVFADCTVTVLHKRTGVSSPREPLALMYNRVSDNRDANLEPCVSARALPGSDIVRLTAAHGYGSVDLRIQARSKWVVLELANMSLWHADPTEKHLVFAQMCPSDMCPSGQICNEVNSCSAGDIPFRCKKFCGYRGSEGLYPDSSGFFSLSSGWQLFNVWWYAQPGWKSGFTVAPTAEISGIGASIEAEVGLTTAVNPNRALPWLWSWATQQTIDGEIERAKQLGVELLFINAFLTAMGDWEVDPKKWPNGLQVARDKAQAAGLKIGLHIRATGAESCALPDLCAPGAGVGLCKQFNSPPVPPSTVPCVAARVASQHLEYFVPQGLAPYDWIGGISAGTWYCHEKTGKACGDHTRMWASTAGADHPVKAPPPNPIKLYGNVSWSLRGRFRSGGAAGFDGATTYGILSHSDEYNFRMNPWMPNATTQGFTLQLVIHPEASGSGKQQVLASKGGEWRLCLTASSRVEWRVHLSDGWATATSKRQVVNGGGASTNRQSFVIKATHHGGVVRIFLCELTASFGCRMRQEGIAQGRLPLAGGTKQPVLWGGELVFSNCSHPCPVTLPFAGAMEELFLARVSFENVTAYAHTAPGIGKGVYLWDYTNPATRSFFANATADLFNHAGAVTAQWDGMDVGMSVHGWDVPHSSSTFNAGFKTHQEMVEQDCGYNGSYSWPGHQLQAFMESRSMWKQPVALEQSFGLSGLRTTDMLNTMDPFADESTIQGYPHSLCVNGDAWHSKMLLSMHESGKYVNAYDTPVGSMSLPSIDCWLGGLVATGVAPQIIGDASTEQAQRVKWWNNRFREFGFANESSISVLHYPDALLVSLVEGSLQTPVYGLYSAGNVTAVLPPLPNNSTILMFCGYNAPSCRVSIPAAQGPTALRLFGARSGARVILTGGFTHQMLRETIDRANGEEESRTLPAESNHTLTFGVGDYATYSVASRTIVRPVAGKTDDNGPRLTASYFPHSTFRARRVRDSSGAVPAKTAWSLYNAVLFR
eukprot:COSAG04_NODE_17_length_40288_cov_9.152728_11_plen_1187_part_00